MNIAPQGILTDRFKLSLAFSVEGQVILQILVTSNGSLVWGYCTIQRLNVQTTLTTKQCMNPKDNSHHENPFTVVACFDR
jgi:hypothetical protein